LVQYRLRPMQQLAVLVFAWNARRQGERARNWRLVGGPFPVAL